MLVYYGWEESIWKYLDQFIVELRCFWVQNMPFFGILGIFGIFGIFFQFWKLIIIKIIIQTPWQYTTYINQGTVLGNIKINSIIFFTSILYINFKTITSLICSLQFFYVGAKCQVILLSHDSISNLSLATASTQKFQSSTDALFPS